MRSRLWRSSWQRRSSSGHCLSDGLPLTESAWPSRSRHLGVKARPPSAEPLKHGPCERLRHPPWSDVHVAACQPLDKPLAQKGGKVICRVAVYVQPRAPIRAVQRLDTRVNRPTPPRCHDGQEDRPSRSMPTSTSPTSGRTSPPARRPRSPPTTAPQPFVVHRDRSLDPQLVWKGKDEQDAQAARSAGRADPRPGEDPPAGDRRGRARRGPQQGKPQLADLFADFNGLDDFAKKLEFYQHDQHWTNRLILGDSLLVMASLAEKERLRGKVQCVYFDPPYGIKFGSNWQVSTRKRDVKDAKAEDLTRQPEQIKAFRDTWELGIHSYLTLPARPPRRRPRPAHRERQHLRPDRRRERASGALPAGRGVRQRELLSLDHLHEDHGASTGELLPGISDYLLWYAKDRRAREVPPTLLEKDSRRMTVRAVRPASNCRTERDAR